MLEDLYCCNEVSIVETSEIFLPETALSTAHQKFWYATTEMIAKIVITTNSSTRVKALFFVYCMQ